MKIKFALISAILIVFAYSCSNTAGAGSNPDDPALIMDTNPNTPSSAPDTTTNNPGTTTSPGTNSGGSSILDPGAIITRSIDVSSTENAGEMGVYFDGSNLIVKGQLAAPYEIQSVYLWIDNDFSSLPLNKVYKTKPTQFPYAFIPASAPAYNFELQPDLNLLTIPVDPANLCQNDLYVSIQINASLTNPDGTITNFSFWVSDYAFSPDQRLTTLNEQGWFLLSLSCQ